MTKNNRPIFKMLIDMHDDLDIALSVAHSTWNEMDTEGAKKRWEELVFKEDAIFQVLLCWSTFGEEE